MLCLSGKRLFTLTSRKIRQSVAVRLLKGCIPGLPNRVSCEIGTRHSNEVSSLLPGDAFNKPARLQMTKRARGKLQNGGDDEIPRNPLLYLDFNRGRVCVPYGEASGEDAALGNYGTPNQNTGPCCTILEWVEGE